MRETTSTAKGQVPGLADGRKVISNTEIMKKPGDATINRITATDTMNECPWINSSWGKAPKLKVYQLGEGSQPNTTLYSESINGRGWRV